METIQERGAVLVTGASGGIGQALVRRLADDGWQVLAAMRRPIAAERFGTLRVDRITPLPLDVTSDDSIAAMRARVDRQLGSEGLRGLVNGAGIIVDGPLELIPPEHFRRQFDVNVTGAFAVTRALLPALRRGRGRIVNIGAVSARTAAPFFGPISASKAALASLSDAMRMEFAPFGIDVALIEPGAIGTGIWTTSAALQHEGLALQGRELVDLYAPAMQAMREAFAAFGADVPEVVVDAVADALAGRRRPAARALVGKGSVSMAMLGHLPVRARDALLMSSLGLTKALRLAARSLREARPLPPADTRSS